MGQAHAPPSISVLVGEKLPHPEKKIAISKMHCIFDMALPKGKGDEGDGFLLGGRG